MTLLKASEICKAVLKDIMFERFMQALSLGCTEVHTTDWLWGPYLVHSVLKISRIYDNPLEG